MNEKPSWTDTFMEVAGVFAKRSELPTRVGAVIVQDKRVVSVGYNGKPAGYPNFRIGQYQLDEIHAEINAISFAARKGISTEKAQMYVTVRPCMHCAKAIVQSGIEDIFCYDKKAKDQDACPDGLDFLRKNGMYITIVEEKDEPALQGQDDEQRCGIDI